MHSSILLLFWAATLPSFTACSQQQGDWQTLEYAPAPVDNPLKGLVPYQGDVRSRFPHSMEFNYLAYSKLVKGYNDYDWQPLEHLLDDVASRGHQTVIRIYLEYPGKKEAIPGFLIKDGLKIHRYLNTNTQPLKAAPVETPDYENENLRRSLKGFLKAFGEKYDGDSRIGFVCAGLLGTWGEWHTYPKEELFASKAVQEEVMTAYESAFPTTPVLLRYPAGESNEQYVDNSKRKFGYHDDSFAWATLPSDDTDNQWFYLALLKAAGKNAESKWKQFPIGGEIRPEAWGIVFDQDPRNENVQDFRECVEATHATWLMDSGMFKAKQPSDRIARAKEQVRRMGYEFHVPRVMIHHPNNELIEVALELENRGVAPFYYDWNTEWALLNGGEIEKTFVGSGKINGLLPGDDTRVWRDSLKLSDVKRGRYQLAVRVVNPMSGGKPLCFANKTQDPKTGWLTLGRVDVR